MNLESEVKKVAAKSEITGVMEMTERCGLSYERTRRVWEAHKNVSLADVRQVLNSIGYDLKVALVELEA